MPLPPLEPTADPLLEEMRSLWTLADEIWDECRDKLEFGGFVSADYLAIYNELLQLQNRATTVLEWGSGLGVVAIMASRLGFEAYGIEVEPLLVERSLELAEKFGPEAQFATGSFIPDDYSWQLDLTGTLSRTETDSRGGYDDIDMQLEDFDLVYAYPWPDEHELFFDIMRSCGRKNSLFLTYDAREGTSLTRIG